VQLQDRDRTTKTFAQANQQQLCRQKKKNTGIAVLLVLAPRG
jgi:hypothetical protein